VLVFTSLNVLGSIRLYPRSPEASYFAFLLFLFSFPILTGWHAFGKWGALAAGCGALFVDGVAYVATGQGALLLFAFYYASLYFLIEWFEKTNEGELVIDEVEREKNENEKNQLDLALKKAADDVDSSFTKYSNYFSLREAAEHLATTLDLDQVAKQVIKEMRSFVPKGDAYLLYLAALEAMSLSLIASSTAREEERIKAKRGDVFDRWVVKNQQPLLVSDTQKDVRFDIHDLDRTQTRCVMIAPLVYEGRVVGICRIDSSQPNAFDTSDLRMFDAVSVLASSAIANALLYQKTEELAIRDSLTGLFVQRYFRERLKEEHGRALLYKTPLSLLMCDLDHFKTYNDTFGHGAGDLMLVRVAHVIQEEVGEDGIVARYGGEEFAVLLPHFSKDEARELAERIRVRLEKEEVEVRREPTRITISIGVSTLPDETLDREDLIRRADQSLYSAKKTGRNRVI
jgi:diguanylate cyclase (GGDEF)-like protein